MNFFIDGSKIAPGCGPCIRYADIAAPFCVVELQDLLEVLLGYGEPPTGYCTLAPQSGALVFAGGCPVECDDNSDCVAPEGTPQCVLGIDYNPAGGGLCCDLTELQEVLNVLGTINNMPNCPSECPHGACDLPLPDNCCMDGSYEFGILAPGDNRGMSRSDCYVRGGFYYGDNSTCAASGLSDCPQ
jgi:hypothetical protein